MNTAIGATSGVDVARRVRSGSDGGCYCRGRGLGDIGIPDIPCGCDGNVDLDIVDDNDGGLGKVFAGGDRVNPESVLVVFVHIAFIDLLEVGTNVFVNDEVLVLLAPFLIRADVLSGTKLDVVVPGRGSNSDNLRSASINSSSRAVGRGSLVSGFDGSNRAIGGSDGSDRARLASGGDCGVPRICGSVRAVSGVCNCTG